jgi:hypothetical protein
MSRAARQEARQTLVRILTSTIRLGHVTFTGVKKRKYRLSVAKASAIFMESNYEADDSYGTCRFASPPPLQSVKSAREPSLRHICTGTGFAPPASAPGRGSPLRCAARPPKMRALQVLQPLDADTVFVGHPVPVSTCEYPLTGWADWNWSMDFEEFAEAVTRPPTALRVPKFALRVRIRALKVRRTALRVRSSLLEGISNDPHPQSTEESRFRRRHERSPFSAHIASLCHSPAQWLACKVPLEFRPSVLRPTSTQSTRPHHNATPMQPAGWVGHCNRLSCVRGQWRVRKLCHFVCIGESGRRKR